MLNNIVLPAGTCTATEAVEPEYIAYPIAINLLIDRLDATPDELVAWLAYATMKNGKIARGLVAYSKELGRYSKIPNSFFMSLNDSNPILKLMGCHFVKNDILNFQPSERYITGKMLVDRWSKHFTSIEQVESWIMSKHLEFALDDFRLTSGDIETEHIDNALFMLNQVVGIESSEFGKAIPAVKVGAGTVTTPAPAVQVVTNSIASLLDNNKVYWRVILKNNIQNFDSKSPKGKATVREIIKALIELEDKRIYKVSNFDAIGWDDDNGNKQVVQKKTVSTAISEARKRP